jgi:hypothetical protein
MRYAKVTASLKSDQDRLAKIVADYLPNNYKVIGQLGDTVFIRGTDDAGWGMDTYVIPRLGSAILRAVEITAEEVTLGNTLSGAQILEGKSNDAILGHAHDMLEAIEAGLNCIEQWFAIEGYDMGEDLNMAVEAMQIAFTKAVTQENPNDK